MQVSEILRALPAALEWMVLFDLPRVRRIAADDAVRAMFGLPADAALDGHSHVVLSSVGKFLAPAEGDRLFALAAGAAAEPAGASLAERFAAQLALIQIDGVHCLGLGEQPPDVPVVMNVVIDADHVGAAQAVFDREPDQRHYGLLRAAGVEYLGGESHGDHFLARFRNRIPVHLLNGRLADYGRTAHCNWFFLRHGRIDAELEQGLLAAAANRVRHGLGRATASLLELGARSVQEGLAMDCVPPPPEPPQPMGDLVPLGLALGVLRKLEATPDTAGLALAINRHLLAQRQGPLWSFQSGRLITATDSALVLQGVRDTGAVAALERFADGAGGYYPQRWAAERDHEHMAYDETVRPWCQPDYGTTCLVRGLRRRAGLPELTPLAYLEAGFERRGALYFANPYLTDWALAQAIAADPAAGALRRRLSEEILASRNADNSFGGYDLALSTALAIVTLAQLGYRGRTLRLAQLRLLDLLEADGGAPVSEPFYSVLYQPAAPRFQRELALYMLKDGGRHVFAQDGRYYAITRYRDTHRLIGTAFAAAALGVVPTQLGEESAVAGPAHPRYRSRSLFEYVRQHALPPYLSVMAGDPPAMASIN